jgi:hypothetical protein
MRPGKQTHPQGHPTPASSRGRPQGPREDASAGHLREKEPRVEVKRAGEKAHPSHPDARLALETHRAEGRQGPSEGEGREQGERTCGPRPPREDISGIREQGGTHRMVAVDPTIIETVLVTLRLQSTAM